MKNLFAAHLCSIVLLLSASTLRAGQSDKTLDIYWVDVEGGGGTLIVTAAGESVLIDSGNPGVRDSGRTEGPMKNAYLTLRGLKNTELRSRAS